MSDVSRIESLLGTVIGKLDMLHEDVRDGASRMDKIDERAEKFDGRLRFVEQFQKWVIGVGSGISMVGGSVFYLLKQKADGL